MCVLASSQAGDAESRRRAFLFTHIQLSTTSASSAPLRFYRTFRNTQKTARHVSSVSVNLGLFDCCGSWKTLRRGGRRSRREFSKITGRRFTLPSNLSSACRGSLYQHVSSKDHSVLVRNRRVGSHLCRLSVSVRVLQETEVSHRRAGTYCVSAPRSDVEPGGR